MSYAINPKSTNQTKSHDSTLLNIFEQLTGLAAFCKFAVGFGNQRTSSF